MAAFENAAPEKHRAAHGVEVGESHVVERGEDSSSVGDRVSVLIGENDVSKKNFDVRVFAEKLVHSGEASRQILFIAIQISAQFTSRAAETAINGVIHAFIGLNENAKVWYARRPLHQVAAGAGILHDVLKLTWRLIRHRRDA